ncbi:uncharacterized protein LOC143853118 [Tasmannia lanceolata]|uniref:uncharacterized protein LOC143853118 n=1 Tax=Tasmannia lanceolata TaxID=3420 RepID=UPI0040627CC7
MEAVQIEKKWNLIELKLGGIGGFLLVGGALAATALLAAFKNRRSKKRSREKSIKDPSKKLSEEALDCKKEYVEGLRSLIQNPSLSVDRNQCEEDISEASVICSTQISPGGLGPIESMILEKESSSEIKGEEVAIEEKIKNVENETIQGGQKDEKQDRQKKEEEEEESDGEMVEEREEEGLDGTGVSSMESKAEAIWPSESIEEIFFTELMNDEIKITEKISGKEAEKSLLHEEEEEEGEIIEEKVKEKEEMGRSEIGGEKAMDFIVKITEKISGKEAEKSLLHMKKKKKKKTKKKKGRL